MSKTIGERIVLSAIICLVGLGVVFIHVQTAATSSSKNSSEVRMGVDPTVLPLVPPPGAPAEVDMPVESVKATEEAEVVESAATPEPKKAPLPPVSEVTETKVEPAAKPEPEKPSKPAPAPTKGKGVVGGLALDSSPAGFVLTVTCDRPVGDTTYMNLSNPKRLVVDLRQPWTLKTRNVIRSAEGPVKHVVVGAHPDRLRLVVHFRTPPKGRLDPTFVRDGNRLVVRVNLP